MVEIFQCFFNDGIARKYTFEFIKDLRVVKGITVFFVVYISKLDVFTVEFIVITIFNIKKVRETI